MTSSEPHPTGERLALFAVELGCLRLAGIPLRHALTNRIEEEVMRDICVTLAEAQDLIDELLEQRRAQVDLTYDRLQFENMRRLETDEPQSQPPAG
jgi:hypothetical protein